MLTSLSEFKYFQSFRLPVESRDDVMFIAQIEDENGKYTDIKQLKLVDVSMSGLGFISTTPIPHQTTLRCSIQFKRLRFDFDVVIVRSFRDTTSENEESMNYGAQLDSDDFPKMKKFIEQYIQSLSPDRLKDSLSQLALSQSASSEREGFEMFSLLLSLFKDITQFGNKEKFVESMLEEIVRLLNAQRASIFLINTETNELEAVAALGIPKDMLKFDYRKGIAGSVFTTGVSLNIDTNSDSVRFTKEMDEVTGYDTKSIICSPITNREDKIIGVIEVLNKRNEDRFTTEDEKTMKVLTLILSSVFHHYNPMSEKTLIRRFSAPYDREFAWIGKSQHTSDIRKAIVKLKDLDAPILIHGEKGVGKKLFARIIHNEGKRGLAPYLTIECIGRDPLELEEEIFGSREKQGKLESCIGGTVLFCDITHMPVKLQSRLVHVLKERKITSDASTTLDVRCLFTTSKNVKTLTFDDGQFNAELYKFMTSSEVTIEPLRKRVADIEDIMSFFLKKECKKQGLLLKEFSKDVKEEMMNYPWPGNVEELSKAIEKAVLYHPKGHVISELGSKAAPIIDITKAKVGLIENVPHADNPDLPLKDRVALVERELILAEIKRYKGNKSKAALAMGISREALRKKMLISDEILENIATGKTAPIDSSEEAA